MRHMLVFVFYCLVPAAFWLPVFHYFGVPPLYLGFAAGMIVVVGIFVFSIFEINAPEDQKIYLEKTDVDAV